MLVLTKVNGETIEFSDRYEASDPFQRTGSVDSQLAWSTALNIRAGLVENKDKLGLDELLVVRNALYERFASLGVSGDLIQPMVTAFMYVEDAIRAKRAN